MNARAMLEQAVAENASDIFLVAGRIPFSCQCL